jgi:hypothetical protein
MTSRWSVRTVWIVWTVSAFGIAAAGLLSLGGVALASDTPVPAGTDFGAGLTLQQVVGVEDVVRDPDRYNAGPILMRGTISDVCQRKGCWTVLRQGEATVRVRFKDYGFFLPADSSGKLAYVEGVVKVETLSEKTARHYAEESGNGKSDSVEAIRGPQREIGFTASGVRLIAN